MTLKTVVVGSHLLFARSGDTIDSVVVSKTAKPDNDPATNWINFGCVEDASFDRNFERETIYCPSPGSYQKEDIITTQKEMQMELTMRKHSAAFFEMLMGNDGAIPDASGSGTPAYTPMSGDGYLRGWFKLQQYDQDEALIHSVDAWGLGSIEGAQNLGKSTNAWTLTVEILNSSLNSAALYNFPIS